MTTTHSILLAIASIMASMICHSEEPTVTVTTNWVTTANIVFITSAHDTLVMTPGKHQVMTVMSNRVWQTQSGPVVESKDISPKPVVERNTL